MKKTLAAIAVLGAFAGTAMAADVTLYGVVDLGLNYQNQKVDGEKSVNKFQQYSGQNSGSRFGLKGSEDLGNGLKVGFVLENGFSADDGQLGQGSRLFGREANLYVQGDFGTVSMGRVGALSSGLGSYNVVYGYTVFGTGWGDFAGKKAEFMINDRDRFDNTVTYVSPNFAGVNVYAQYSFQAAGTEDAQSTKNKRYAAVGAKYTAGAFSTGLVVDTVKNASTNSNTEDSLGVSWGASYDFGVAKVVGLAQYGKNEKTLGGYSVADGADLYSKDDIPGADSIKVTLKDEGVEGYALALGTIVPVCGGTFYAQVNYTDGETVSDADASVQGYNAAGDKVNKIESKFGAEFDRWGLAAAYSYPLSKRTFVYGFAAYNEGKVKSVRDTVALDSVKTKDTEFGFGMVHKF